MKATGILVAVVLLLTGVLALWLFVDDGAAPRIVGITDLAAGTFLLAAMAAGFSRRGLLLAAAVMIPAVAYVWSTLDWSAGRDASGLAWLYIVGALHLMSLIVAVLGSTISRGLEKSRS